MDPDHALRAQSESIPAVHIPVTETVRFVLMATTRNSHMDLGGGASPAMYVSYGISALFLSHFFVLYTERAHPSPYQNGEKNLFENV